MVEGAQRQVDTRALEMATAAKSMIEQHMKACEQDRAEAAGHRREVRQELQAIRQDIGDGLDKVHGRINEVRAAGGGLVLRVAYGIIALLLMVIGYLAAGGHPFAG